MITLVAAVAENGVIGAGNRMPWYLKEDLQRFRALTLGHGVVMGRKTWESLGGPLPGRRNVVVSRQELRPEGEMCIRDRREPGRASRKLVAEVAGHGIRLRLRGAVATALGVRGMGRMAHGRYGF